MLRNIKITENELRYMALLERMTGATVLDCILVKKEDSIIFAVKKGEVGLAVGRRGEKIKRFRKLTNKKVDIYEYIDDPIKFIRSALKPAKVKDIKLVERIDGSRIAMVRVEERDKGIAIGKNGRNIKKVRFLAKRYFGLETIIIS